MLKRATELSVRTGDTAFAMNVKTHRAVLCQDGIEVKLTQARAWTYRVGIMVVYGKKFRYLV